MSHVNWIPCHHSILLPQCADGEDGLQKLMVVASILEIRLGDPTAGGPPSLLLGGE